MAKEKSTQSKLLQLSIQYQGEDKKNKLLGKAKQLYTEYGNLKSSNRKKTLKKQVEKYEKTINEFIEINEKFYARYINKDETERDTAKFYVEHSQIHINKLQSQSNQLIYRQQHCYTQLSLWIAYIALGITLFFSILSFFDIKWTQKPSKVKIEQLSDSINTLNKKIEQQNKLIINHSDSSPENSVVPVQEEDKTRETKQ